MRKIPRTYEVHFGNGKGFNAGTGFCGFFYQPETKSQRIGCQTNGEKVR